VRPIRPRNLALDGALARNDKPGACRGLSQRAF
jgi:hypothetical protein